MRHLDRRTIALVALVAVSVLWGYNWVVVKIAMGYAAPFTFVAWRTLGGGILLGLIGLALRRQLRPEPPVLFYAVLGFFQTAGLLGLATWAVVTTGAGQVAILVYTMPLWCALLAWPFLGERVNLKQGVAILVAFVGILCMLGPIAGTGFADLVAIAAGLSWAIGVIYMKRHARGRHIDLYRLTMWQMLCAGVMLAIVAAAAHEPAIDWTPTFVAALLYNIVIANALGYSMWFFVLSILPAGEASMGSLLAPVVGVIAAWAQLGERPSLLEGLGMLLVLGGVTLLSYIRGRPAR